MWKVLTVSTVALVGCFEARVPTAERDSGRPRPPPVRDLGSVGGADASDLTDAGSDFGVDATMCLAAEESCDLDLDLDCDGRRGCMADCDCWQALVGPCGRVDIGYEMGCANGFSEDSDLLIDCDDPDCVDAIACGGSGRCGFTILGDSLPVREIFAFPIRDDTPAPFCFTSGTWRSSYRWVAPFGGRFRFRTNGGSIALRHGGCDGPTIECSAGEVVADLDAAEHVVVVLDGGVCRELDIDPL